MRSRAVINTLTALALVVWLNIVGGLLVPQFAEALRPNEWCDPAIKSCMAFGNGCQSCTPFGQTGDCTGPASFPCTNTATTCADGFGCSCNPSAC